MRNKTLACIHQEIAADYHRDIERGTKRLEMLYGSIDQTPWADVHYLCEDINRRQLHAHKARYYMGLEVSLEAETKTYTHKTS